MKAIFFADLQLSNSLSYGEFGDDGTSSRLRDQTRAVGQIIGATIDDPEIKFGVFAGDWFDNSVVDPYTLRSSAKILGVMDDPDIPPWFIMAGNHDFIDKHCRVSIFDQYTEFRQKFDHVEFITTPQCREIGNVLLSLIPYTRDMGDRQLVGLAQSLPRQPEDTDGHAVLVLHSPVYDATLNHLAQSKAKFGLTVKALSELGYEWIVLGDFHVPQILAPNIFYCGCPLALDFGDANDQRGYWVIDFDKNDLQFYPTEHPEFIRLDVTDKELKKLDLQDKIKPKSIVKCTVSTTKAKFDTQALRQEILSAGASRAYVSVQRTDGKKAPKAADEDLLSKMGVERAIEEMVRLNPDLSEQDKSVYLEVGMKYYRQALAKEVVGE